MHSDCEKNWRGGRSREGNQVTKDSALWKNTEVLRKETELGHYKDYSETTQEIPNSRKRLVHTFINTAPDGRKLAASRCGRFIPEKINNLNGPGGLLPFRLPTKLLYVFLIPVMRAICPAQLVQLYCIILILHGISITTPSTTVLPHRKPACVGITRDSWGAQDDRRNALYVVYAEYHKLWNYKLHTFIFLFQTFAVFWMLYAFFRVIPRPENYPEESIQHPHTFFCGATPHIGPRPRPPHWLRYIAHTGGLLRMSDQLVAKATTYTTHNKHNRRTSMPSVECEPTFPANKPPPIYAVDRAANGIGFLFLKFNYSPWHPVSQRFQCTPYA